MTPFAHSLTVHHDARGRLAVLLAQGIPPFQKFGQIYFTTLHPGIIKAWHRHKFQIDFQSCISGTVRIVVSDGKNVWQWVSGETAPTLIEIPQQLWHGIENLSEKEAIVVNCPTEVYNEKEPDEERLSWDSSEIPFEWNKRNG